MWKERADTFKPLVERPLSVEGKVVPRCLTLSTKAAMKQVRNLLGTSRLHLRNDLGRIFMSSSCQQRRECAGDIPGGTATMPQKRR